MNPLPQIVISFFLGMASGGQTPVARDWPVPPYEPVSACGVPPYPPYGCQYICVCSQTRPECHWVLVC